MLVLNSQTVCGEKMAARLIHHHTKISHRRFMRQIQWVDIGREETETYVESFTILLTSTAYPVEGCPEISHNPGRLREYFMYRHNK